MHKKVTLSLVTAVALLCVFTGCNANRDDSPQGGVVPAESGDETESVTENPAYSKMDVYQAEKDTIIGSVDDAEELNEINEAIRMGEGELSVDSTHILEESLPEYYFVFYDNDDRADFVLTIYKDSDYLVSQWSNNFGDALLDEDTTQIIYLSSRVSEYLRELIETTIAAE